MRRVRYSIGAFLALLATIWAAPLHAQGTGTIRGRVIDAESSRPLPGVTVTFGVRNTLTQSDGGYVLTALPAGSDSLRVRMLGYAPASRYVAVASGQTITANFTMTAQAVSLGEIVVTGYGEQRAGDITGAITQLDSSDFNPRAVNPADMIQGKVAGVQVVDNNEPGGGQSIRIRGTTSVNASSEPLYVIDGVPVGGTGAGGGLSAGRDPLNFLNPDDIANITVLRDASAAAIYGANGASGVILITTKQGQRGGPQFEYSTSVSASDVTRVPDMLSADEFRTAVTQYAPQYVNQLGSANTNWFDQVTRTGYGQTHNLSVSGAGETNTWRLSFGYLNQDGVVRGSTLKRYSLGLNLTQRLFHDRVNVNANVRGARSDDNFTPGGYGIGGVISNAANMGPTQPVLDPTTTTGYYNWPGNSLTSADNPVEILNLAQNHGTTYRSIGNVQLSWRLPLLGDAVSAHANLGYDVTQVNSANFGPSVLHAEQKTAYYGELAQNNNNQANSVFETYLTYSAPVAALRGNLDLTAGYSYSQSKADYRSLYERGLSTDLLGTNGVPSAQSVSPSAYVDASRLISFFGRANYNVNDKYLLAFSLRRDGSSRFGPNNAWGVFPSAAFAWRISQESFMQSFRSLSDLKLRVSWARTGNQNFANYLSYAAFTYSNPQGQVQFGNQFITTIRPAAVDPNIKWEATTSVNVGVDWGFSNQRYSGSIDWYNKKTSDMIFSVPVAGGSNLSNYVTTNIGDMRNRGFELSLHARVLNGGRGGLGWNADFTFAHNKNTLLSINPSSSASSQILVGGISGGVGNTVQVLTPGAAVNSFFLCRQVYDASGKPTQNSYYDSTGAVVTGCTNDRAVEHSPDPSAIIGHSSYLTYGRFDFSFSLRAYLGNYVYNNVASAAGDYRELYAGTSPYNLHRSVLETGFTQAQYLSDYYLEKASFLRMDNITLGYALNIRGQPARLYGTVQNVFTITGYSGVDPTAGLNGIDNNIYPRARTFTGGMSIRF